MKVKELLVLSTMIILGISLFSACSNPVTTYLTNELRFPLDKISSLTISYDEETISLFEGTNDELIIREYMSTNKKRYHAKVKEGGNSIQISEGSKPFPEGDFVRYVEVYLPVFYQQNLTVTSTSGAIDFGTTNLELLNLSADTTSGTIILSNTASDTVHLTTTSGTLKLGDIKANQINIKTTSGTVSCSGLTGNVTYTSTSGNLEVISAIGSGSYTANNSGQIKVAYLEVDGNLTFTNKNDNIDITLPPDLEFKFEAATKNGSISTPFQENLTFAENEAHGIVGDNPRITIKAETHDGDIAVCFTTLSNIP